MSSFPNWLDPRAGSTPGTRVTRALTATVVGIYLLIVLGAVTSIMAGSGPCVTWPVCPSGLAVGGTDLTAIVAWIHRIGAVAVGALLAWTTRLTWRHAPGRVAYAVGGAALLYPVELVIGGLAATTGAALPVTAAHLVVAVAIFSTVLLALLWHLEDRTVDPDPAATTEVDPPPATGSVEAPPDGDRRWGDRARDYLALTKPKLMWLLCLVAVAAMGLAAGPTLAPGTVAATLAGGVFAIGASGTFNNVLERDRDRHMSRTDDRPLVDGRVSPTNAVLFGVALTVASVAVFLVYVNLLAATLGVLAILFYSVGYTLVLKPNTTQNIVLGGAVGAFPALIGWAAVTNTVGLPAIVLGAVIFVWTPAHFYNLALAYREDYERGGFPMLPVVHGDATTRRHILGYLGVTMLGAVVLGATTRLGLLYAATITVVGTVFLWAIVVQYRERTTEAAFRTFHASNAYLGGLLLAITADTLIV